MKNPWNLFTAQKVLYCGKIFLKCSLQEKIVIRIVNED